MVSTNGTSDLGLIVQGTLILLSSVVAVIGYLIQSNLRKKERNEMKRLDRLTEKFKSFISPAQGYAFQFMVFCLLDLPKIVAECGYDAEIKKHQQEMGKNGWTMGNMFSGKVNLLNTFVGKELEQQIVNNPKTELANIYRASFRSAIEMNAVPLAELIRTKFFHLAHFQPIYEWKKMFPCEANAITARATFFLQFVSFTESCVIMLKEWDKKNYSKCFPYMSYPSGINWDLNFQAQYVREQEVKFNVADNMTDEDVVHEKLKNSNTDLSRTTLTSQYQ